MPAVSRFRPTYRMPCRKPESPHFDHCVYAPKVCAVGCRGSSMRCRDPSVWKGRVPIMLHVRERAPGATLGRGVFCARNPMAQHAAEPRSASGPLSRLAGGAQVHARVGSDPPAARAVRHHVAQTSSLAAPALAALAAALAAFSSSRSVHEPYEESGKPMTAAISDRTLAAYSFASAASSADGERTGW
eukprot:2209526-Prymnesium_polylepis.1